MVDWTRRLLAGERRHRHRPRATASEEARSTERVQIVNRQAAVAEQLSRRLGTTPEELYDYHRADQILGKRQ